MYTKLLKSNEYLFKIIQKIFENIKHNIIVYHIKYCEFKVFEKFVSFILQLFSFYLYLFFIIFQQIVFYINPQRAEHTNINQYLFLFLFFLLWVSLYLRKLWWSI